MHDDARPTDLLEPLGMTETELAPGVRLGEIFTMRGILSLLWFGPADADRLVVACGGGMGGHLGPGRALYPSLGTRLAAAGIATVAVDYRRPSHEQLCVLDAIAAVDLASQRGAARVVALGHSFGGAVAVNLALALPSSVVGICTLSTQSAGCEGAAGIAPRPFLLLHGANDEVLPPETSHVVQMLAGGHGEVEILPGEGHGLSNDPAGLLDRVATWILATFGEGR